MYDANSSPDASGGDENAGSLRAPSSGRPERTTIPLVGNTKEGIAKIRDECGLTTDAAAVTEAIRFRAKLADRDLSEVMFALEFLDVARDLATDGKRCVFLKPTDIPRGADHSCVIVPRHHK